MKNAFFKTVKRLMPSGGVIYAFISSLLMSLLMISVNLLGKEGSLSGALAYLSGAQTVLFPFFIINFPSLAGTESGSGAHVQGAALAYLAVFGLSCIPLWGAAAMLIPQPDSWAALAGYMTTYGALLTGCMLLVMLFGRKSRWRGLAAAIVFMFLMDALPQIACRLDESRAGAAIARTLLYLLPTAGLNGFLNGSLNLQQAGYCAALMLANLYFLGGFSVRRIARGLSALALAAALLAVQPASVFQIDMTPQQVTTPSPEMTSVLRGLNLPVTVYQVSPVGEEDLWEELYLKKLSERHKMIAYRLVSPAENSGMDELSLPANSLVVEQDEQWVVIRYENLYQQRMSADGAKVTFELEGALLTALDEATGLTMTEVCTPYGRMLNRTFDTDDQTRFHKAVCLMLWPAGLLAAGIIILILRKRHA